MSVQEMLYELENFPSDAEVKIVGEKYGKESVREVEYDATENEVLISTLTF